MPSLPHSLNTYYPLRRFAAPGLYTTAYLSQLVQRDRLEAKQIGRNYCTSRACFEKYLRQHAKDGVRDEYRELFRQADEEHFSREQKIRQSLQPKYTPTPQYLKISYRAIAIVMVFLFFLLSAVVVVPKLFDDGIVAGVEEVVDR
jgi:hypothetical protein